MAEPRDKGLVLDASTGINLVATGRFSEIIVGLGRTVYISRSAYEECAVNPRTGEKDAELLLSFVEREQLSLEHLKDAEAELWLDLMEADPPDDLGDGESATIALAAMRALYAVLDDRKAIRVARARFPSIQIVSTVELLREPGVEECLGIAGVGDAVFDALRFARMRVPPEHEDWVRNLIGAERASLCRSLKRR